MSDIRDVLASVLKDAVESQLKEEATALVVHETRDLSTEERLRRVEVETAINKAKIEVIEKHLGHMIREYTAMAEHTLDISAAFLFLGVSKYLNRDLFTTDEINEILNDASERQAQSFGDEEPEHYILNFGPFVEDAIREFVAKKG